MERSTRPIRLEEVCAGSMTDCVHAAMDLADRGLLQVIRAEDGIWCQVPAGGTAGSA